MKKLSLLTSLASALTILSAGNSFAAKVPEGTQLAPVQEYRQSIAANPDSLDINKAQEILGSQIMTQLFETLVVFDQNGKIIPGAAESWQHSDDYKVWTFNLRKDAKWSNGEPVVAQDFVTSFKRLLNPENAFAYGFYLRDLNVKGAKDYNEGKASADDVAVKALDDYTFQVTLDGPVPWFLQAMALVVLAPVPTKLVEAGKWPDLDNYVSNGAYKLESALTNDSYTLVRNPNYWNDKETVINKAVYYVVPQNTSAYKRLQSGDLDAVQLSTPSLVKLASEDNSLELVSGGTPRLDYLSFNLKKGPFVNKDLRRAFQLAVDTKQIEEKVLRDTITATTNFIAPAIPGAEKLKEADFFSWPIAKRQAEARKLLEKAGYSKSNPLEFTYTYTSASKLLALAIQSQLKRTFGSAVIMNLQNLEPKTFIVTRHSGNFEWATSGWGADYMEPSTFVSIWTCNSGINDARYCSKDYEDAFNALFNTKTEEERDQLYAKMNKLLQDDVPALVAYADKVNWAINPKLKGLTVDDNFRRIAYMYFVK